MRNSLEEIDENYVYRVIKQNRKGVPFRPRKWQVCHTIYFFEKSSIDLSRVCYRHVPMILHVSIEVSQFNEYRIVIVSRCLAPLGGATRHLDTP